MQCHNCKNSKIVIGYFAPFEMELTWEPQTGPAAAIVGKGKKEEERKRREERKPSANKSPETGSQKNNTEQHSYHVRLNVEQCSNIERCSVLLNTNVVKSSFFYFLETGLQKRNLACKPSRPVIPFFLFVARVVNLTFSMPDRFH